MDVIDMRCSDSEPYVPDAAPREYADLLLQKSGYIRDAIEGIDPQGILLVMGPELQVPKPVLESPLKKMIIETNPGRADLSPLADKNTTVVHADIRRFPYNEYNPGENFDGTQTLRKVLEHMGPARDAFEKILNIIDQSGGLSGCLLFNVTTQLSGTETSMKTGIVLQILANNLRIGARLHSICSELDPLVRTRDRDFLPETWKAVAESFDEPLQRGEVRKHCRWEHVSLLPMYSHKDAFRASYAIARTGTLMSDIGENKCKVEAVESDPDEWFAAKAFAIGGTDIKVHRAALPVNRLLRRDFKSERAARKADKKRRK